MDNKNSILKELVEIYDKTKQEIIRIECITAYDSLTIATMDDLKEILDHTMQAIDLLASKQENKEKIRNKIYEIITHILELKLDSFEHVAGLSLAKLQERLTRASFFSNTSKSIAFFKEAVKNYSEARINRNSNPELSIQYFEKVIENSSEGNLLLVNIPKRVKIEFIFATIIAISAIIILIMKLI